MRPVAAWVLRMTDVAVDAAVGFVFGLITLTGAQTDDVVALW